VPWAECFIGSPPGVPLEEVDWTPGTVPPRDGWVTANDGPGFGIDMPPEWFEPFFA